LEELEWEIEEVMFEGKICRTGYMSDNTI